MKQIQVQVPKNNADIVEDLIENYEIQSAQMELIGGDRLFVLKIDDDQSNNLLHELKARGIGDVFGEISLLSIPLHISSAKQLSSVNKSSAANLEEILANIEEMAVLSGSYIALVVLSGALAAFGLIGDSVVIIIGSMIVAPLLAPVALTSIGVLLPQRGLFKKGLTAEAVGIILTVLVGLIIGLVIGFPKGITDQMTERANQADPYNVAFAIISGIAAGVIISKGQSISIVGVAIAASLAPPAANIGLYLALGDFPNAEIAAALLLINILAINASCSIMFSIFGLPTKAGISKRRASKARRMNTIITIITLLSFVLLSIFLLLQLSDSL